MLRGFMRPGNENKAREEHVLSRNLCTAAAFAALAIAAPARA
jgi:hypothetical protein